MGEKRLASQGVLTYCANRTLPYPMYADGFGLLVFGALVTSVSFVKKEFFDKTEQPRVPGLQLYVVSLEKKRYNRERIEANRRMDMKKRLIALLCGLMLMTQLSPVSAVEPVCQRIASDGFPEETYTSVEEALAQYDVSSGGYIRLLKNVYDTVTIDKPVYLDTNG